MDCPTQPGSWIEDVGVNEIGSNGKLPLESSINNNMEEVAMKIIHRKDFDPSDTGRALRLAIAKKMYVVSLKLTMFDNFSCNMIDLQKALTYKAYFIAARILEHKSFPINSYGNFRRNSLIQAIQCGAWVICYKILQDPGLDINHVDKYKKNALMYLIEWHRNCWDYSRKNFYDINKVNEEDRQWKVELYNLILTRPDLDINYQDKRGHTAYLYLFKQVDIIYTLSKTARKLMLDHPNMDINLRIGDDYTVFLRAIYWDQDSEHVAMLMDHPSFMKNVKNLGGCIYDTEKINKLSAEHKQKFNKIWRMVHAQFVPV